MIILPPGGTYEEFARPKLEVTKIATDKAIHIHVHGLPTAFFARVTLGIAIGWGFVAGAGAALLIGFMIAEALK